MPVYVIIFNTPAAFGCIHVVLKELNRVLDEKDTLTQDTFEEVKKCLDDYFTTLGFYEIGNTILMVDTQELEEKVRKMATDFHIVLSETMSLDEIVKLFIEKRSFSRQNKDF